MKQLFLGTVALTVLATAASAADMAPSYAKAPMAAPIYNWTGFYIGLNAGAASSDVNFDVYTQAAPPNVFDQHQIGRASCRDRVQISVVGGAVKKATREL